MNLRTIVIGCAVYACSEPPTSDFAEPPAAEPEPAAAPESEPEPPIVESGLTVCTAVPQEDSTNSVEWTFDGLNLLKKEIRNLETGEQVELDRRRYDTAGQIEYALYESASGSRQEAQYTWSDGRLVQQAVLFGTGEDQYTSTTTYEYDESERLTRLMSDWSGDPDPERVSTYEYDEQSRIAAIWHDGIITGPDAVNGVMPDGVDDAVERRTYPMDDLHVHTLDIGVDDVIEQIESVRFDAEGRRIERKVDIGDDGILDRHTTWQFEDGLLVEEQELVAYEDRGARPPTSRTYTYDADGLNSTLRTLGPTERRFDGRINCRPSRPADLGGLRIR